MARPRRIDATFVAKAQRLAGQAANLRELRMAQSILLPATAGLSLEQTAGVLGVGRATVARLQKRLRCHGQPEAAGPRPWGGRRRALLTWQEEQAFLAQWQDRAEQGELVVLTPLRAALDRQVGRRVKPSVVYRLVQRHRWRKVAPDTRPPKADPPVQDEGKKNAARKAGGRVDAHGGAAPARSANVPSRGPFWPEGAQAPLLGSGPLAADRAQGLRTAIHLGLWRGQSGGGPTGLEPERPDEQVLAGSQSSASAAIHCHGGGRRQFA